jgi:hypothetical protein
MAINLTPGTVVGAYGDASWLGYGYIEENEGEDLTIVLVTHNQKTWYRLPKDKLEADRSFHLEDCEVKEIVWYG